MIGYFDAIASQAVIRWQSNAYVAFEKSIYAWVNALAVPFRGIMNEMSVEFMYATIEGA
ncbi:hypothetical protein Lepto7375DRAFT_2960 [Leptolyngbya sp. PCC 7375]|nr:hypothetical protein Lepto7375DRAFT_2960 [Leptolyngbya sp. PCC 7375]